jgi:hypothetical protein
MTQSEQGGGEWIVKTRAPGIFKRWGCWMLGMTIVTIGGYFVHGYAVDPTQSIIGLTFAAVATYFHPPKVVTSATFRTPPC